MTKTLTAAPTAAEALAQLDRAAEELSGRRDSLLGEIAAATEARAVLLVEGLLAGKEPPRDSGTLELRGALDDCDAALVETRRRRPALARAAKEEQARDLRAHAAELLLEADHREVETTRLLDLLEAHEGIRFAAPSWAPPSQSTTRTDYLRREAQSLYGRAKVIERELTSLDE